MLRRLHPEQPESFAFTPANQDWAEAQCSKYPAGRQASAVIPLLWRAQEQEGWLTRPAIEYVADMLGMAHIRVLEVATFYFMFQLQPVGSVAHIQVCGTLSCMICGAEDLIAVCKDKIADRPHKISADGKFSWEEVECLGACSNAPMAQIGKDYYEDLTAERFAEIIDELASGKTPVPGPQNGRFAAEPLSGLTSLTEYESGRTQYNASAARAVELGDTVKRIDGSEAPILTPWLDKAAHADVEQRGAPANAVDHQVTSTDATKTNATSSKTGAASKTEKTATKARRKPSEAGVVPAAKEDVATAKAADTGAKKERKPRTMKAPRKSGADDLKRISGVGPKLEALLNEMGFWHFDQIANWGTEEIAWVDSRLKFKGRIERDNWVAQATALAKDS